MGKNKLDKFAEMRQFPNVFQNFDYEDPQLITAGGKKVQMKGKWKERFFDNSHPICLELACGRGEYTVNLAQMYPEKNFIGIDIKGARMHKGAKSALEKKLENVAFLRIRIEQITEFFAEEEVSEIWITFPDPFLKKSDRNKRLTSPQFMQRYFSILERPSILHLKTDSTPLYEYTRKVVEKIEELKENMQYSDIYKEEAPPLKELEIKTKYEKMHLSAGKRIKYIQMKYLPSGKG